MSMSCVVNAKPLPSLFISHGGGPSFFLKDNDGPQFKDLNGDSTLAKYISNSIKAIEKDYLIKSILIISAHWEENEFAISYNNTSLIYDYYGFPSYTYDLNFPAKTDMNLSNKISDLLNNKNIKNKKVNRGFDHGVFCPLLLADPSGKYPIVQLSLLNSLDPAKHIELGEALSELRYENILIIGSGSFTHNLGDMGILSKPPKQYINDFVLYMKNLLESTNKENYNNNKNLLINIKKKCATFQ